MKECRRWRSEEDAILKSYVKQFGPREFHLLPQRMNAVPFQRDAKSCLERWKNYLKPGIKKGSLSEEEQRLVIKLQAKHGNKWKKITQQVPGRTAKRLGKWWEVFKEKQNNNNNSISNSNSNNIIIEPGKYDRILENFAEKILLLHNKDNHNITRTTTMIPSWLQLPAPAPAPPALPSVDLTLWNPLPTSAACSNSNCNCNSNSNGSSSSSGEDHSNNNNNEMVVMKWCREMEEGFRRWMGQRKEAEWRLSRLQLQMESDRDRRRREVIKDFEARIREIKEEETRELQRLERDSALHISEIRRHAEDAQTRMTEDWEHNHNRLRTLIHHSTTRNNNNPF